MAGDQSYTPNQIPLASRLLRTAGAIVLIAHGVIGVLNDDVIIPTKRSVIHLHGISGWVMAASIFCAALVLVSAVVDHFDRRDNEATYKRFGRWTARLGWMLMGAAMGLQAAGVNYPGPSSVTTIGIIGGLFIFASATLIGFANEKAVERAARMPPPATLPGLSKPRLDRSFAGLLLMIPGALIFLGVLPGLIQFKLIQYAIAAGAVVLVIVGWLVLSGWQRPVSTRAGADAPKARNWRPIRIGIIVIVGLAAIWYAKARQWGQWLDEDEAERLKAPAWNYHFDDFTSGTPQAAIQKHLSAEGFRMRCYGNLEPREKIEPEDTSVCWTITRSAYGIPSRMLVFFFGDDGLHHMRQDFPKEEWERVRKWLAAQGDADAGHFGRDQGGAKILGRRGKTGLILASEPGFMGWTMVMWQGRDRVMKRCQGTNQNDPKWRLICIDWPEPAKPSNFMARHVPPAPKPVEKSLPQMLEGIYADFMQCRFDKFYWDERAPHPYFASRGLRPVEEKDGVARFRVFDVLYGLQVRELVVPVTWAYHGVAFDEPLAAARRHLKARFGDEFRPGVDSKQGRRPELIATADGRHSALVCHEGEPGQQDKK